MAVTDLKANFQNQLKEIDEKIEQIQGELTKAKEYKLKLIGGLETLDLLEQQNKSSIVEDDIPNTPKILSEQELKNLESDYIDKGHPKDDVGLPPEETTEE